MARQAGADTGFHVPRSLGATDGDEIVRVIVVGQLVRRRWRFLAILAAIGALLGGATWWLLAPGYLATSKVLLQGSPGEQGVLAETQIATSLVVLDQVAEGLGNPLAGRELQDRVTATVVNGNVVAISVVDASPDRAQQLTDRVTHEYMTFSAQIVGEAASATAQVLQVRRDELQRQVDQTRDRITELQSSDVLLSETGQTSQARAELDRLSNDLANSTAELQDANAKVEEADAEVTASRGHIIVIEEASLRGPASPTVAQMVGGGALLLAGLGLFGLLLVMHKDQRLRDPDEVAAALGAPLLASVSVAAAVAWSAGGDGTASSKPDRRSRLLEFLRDDDLWSAGTPVTVSDVASEDIRYRRVLARLRTTPDADLRLTLVVSDDDAAAYRAVTALAAAAAERDPVSVVTDNADLSRLLRETAGGLDGDASALTTRGLTVRGSTEPSPRKYHTVLRVVDVVAGHPIVPGGVSTAGAVVVSSVGTRTAWELVGVAGACADANLTVLGALAVRSLPTIADHRTLAAAGSA